MKRDKSRQGAALVTVLIVVVLMTLAGATVINLASQQSYAANRVREQVKAQALAEAGANEAYSILKADFSQRESDEAFPEKTFEDGAYDATVTPVGLDMALISCAADCGAVAATVMCDVKDYNPSAGGGSPPPPQGVFAYAIVAGTIFWAGNGPTDVSGGDVHANGEYRMNGTVDLTCDLLSSVTKIRSTGNCTITGDAEAPSWQGSSPANVSGTATTAAVDPVADPGLDLTPYYQFALDNGEVYNGNQTIAAGTLLAPDGGVMWVNGDLHVSGNSTLQGCFIATGDIKISGNACQTQVGDLPAYISRDGDVELVSCGTHEGFIYAPMGDVKMSGGGTFTGTLFCNGEFKKTGSWAAIAYVDSTPPDDPANPSGGANWSEVGITCWHR